MSDEQFKSYTENDNIVFYCSHCKERLEQKEKKAAQRQEEQVESTEMVDNEKEENIDPITQTKYDDLPKAPSVVENEIEYIDLTASETILRAEIKKPDMAHDLANKIEKEEISTANLPDVENKENLCTNCKDCQAESSIGVPMGDINDSTEEDSKVRKEKTIEKYLTISSEMCDRPEIMRDVKKTEINDGDKEGTKKYTQTQLNFTKLEKRAHPDKQLNKSN